MRAKISEHEQQQQQQAGDDVMRQYEKALALRLLDSHWKEHLANMDHLRMSIGLRGYAQKDPKQEYKREAFKLFQQMLDRLEYSLISSLAKVQVVDKEGVAAIEAQNKLNAEKMQLKHSQVNSLNPEEAENKAVDGDKTAKRVNQTVVRSGQKVGRNDACPCGSGKKYKQCCGRID